MYIHSPVRFEWDPEKARTNRIKHGIEFAGAIEVLFDPFGLTSTGDHEGEFRHVPMGCDAFGRLLVVIYVLDREHVRVISARRVTRRERAAYEEGP